MHYFLVEMEDRDSFSSLLEYQLGYNISGTNMHIDRVYYIYAE